jgi:hypothetical protein
MQARRVEKNIDEQTISKAYEKQKAFGSGHGQQQQKKQIWKTEGDTKYPKLEKKDLNEK